MKTITQPFNFVLVRSDHGDGGWSLHAPGSSDDDIANGDAPYLCSGPAEWVNEDWNRPNSWDYLKALGKITKSLSHPVQF